MGFGEDEKHLEESERVRYEMELQDQRERQVFINPYAGRQPTDQAAQVRAALFNMPIPSEKNFEEWFPVLRAAIDMVARIPGYDTKIYNKLNRDMEDLVDRANSQGRRRIVASKMQKFVFRLRSLVPKGDVPIQGMTGVSAMITTNVNQKSSTAITEARMPQAPPPTSLFAGVKKFLGRGGQGDK